MRNIKLMHSFGNKDILNYDYQLPKMREDQIEIQTKFTGICRSDIGAYNGWEQSMPLGMFGHEGIGIVSRVGNQIKDIVKVGDAVATWSDPAYGEYYYATENEFVHIPELHSKYIMQPVGSAINIFYETLKYIDFLNYTQEPILLIGSGFMSLVIAQVCNNPDFLHVVGNSNKEMWNTLGYKLYSNFNELPRKKYKVIIDLSSKASNFDIITMQLSDIESLICYASTPITPVTTNFFENCWNCHTFIMPSPRNLNFKEAMHSGVSLIKQGKLNTEMLWTKGYDAFDLDSMKLAFTEGTGRKNEYLRGYFKF